MSKGSSTKCYQDNKERLQKRKNNNMGINDIKISLRMKSQGWFSMEKKC